MIKKFSLVGSFFPLSLLAAICFNNWIFGFLLNYKLLKVNGSISELSVADQPHAVIFRSLDVIAGLFLVILGILWHRSEGFRTKGGGVIFWGLLILGIANIADALMPLGCSETLNSSCNVPVSLSLHRFVLPDHAYSSTAIGLGYFLLPLGGWIYARQNKLKTFLLISRLIFALNLLFFASILHEYAMVGVTVKASGWLQEAQMLAIGFWVVSCGYSSKTLASKDR